MSLDDALFLVQRSGTLHHSKGSDIGDRMVAGDMVLVQRGTDHFKATYDGNEWSTIQDSDLLLAWDGTNNRKVTGATFKTLFKSLYGNFIGDWKKMQYTPNCSTDRHGAARFNGNERLELQYHDSDGVDHFDEIVQLLDSGEFLACNSSTFGLRLYQNVAYNNNISCYLFFTDYDSATDEWIKNYDTKYNELKVWAGVPGPFATWNWKGDLGYASACAHPSSAWLDTANRRLFFSEAIGGSDFDSQHSLNQWFNGIADIGWNELPFYIEFDDGYMLLVGKRTGTLDQDFSNCNMVHRGTSSQNRTADGIYNNYSGKLKGYNFFPGQFRDTIRGQVYSNSRGATTPSNWNNTRLDQFGNYTNSSTWYGTFFSFANINGDQSPSYPLYGYDGFEASHELGIEGVTGSVMGVESTSSNVTIDMVAMNGIWGIRIWGKTPSTTTSGVANLRGVPLRRI